MLIRRERAADISTVEEIHRQAFARPDDPDTEPIEVGLLRALRTDPGWAPALSLVAEDASGEVVGHVVCTMGSIGDTPVPGLGPIAVLPERQADGVGHALMHAVLGAADALGHPVVVLLGSTEYYPRFGFVPASTLGIEAPEAEWGDHFQVRTFASDGPEVRGRFRYAAPFEAL